jgi:tRNA(His) guanylyltransferase
MFDKLADRIKDFYESRTQSYLMRRCYSIIRVDGKNFSRYTSGLERPFDPAFIEDMNQTAIALCKEVQGAVLGYVQSDEISVVMADFQTHQTDSWFDGNIQKIVSIASSTATAEFNKLRYVRAAKAESLNLDRQIAARFDARVFSLPNSEEVINCLVWRQQDATRNSISAVARSFYSHKELEGMGQKEMQEMIFQKGKNWNDYPIGQKRGRVVVKRTMMENVTIPNKGEEEVVRNRWVVEDPPIFSQEREYLSKVFQTLENNSEK